MAPNHRTLAFRTTKFVVIKDDVEAEEHIALMSPAAQKLCKEVRQNNGEQQLNFWPKFLSKAKDGNSTEVNDHHDSNANIVAAVSDLYGKKNLLDFLSIQYSDAWDDKNVFEKYSFAKTVLRINTVSKRNTSGNAHEDQWAPVIQNFCELLEELHPLLQIEPVQHAKSATRHDKSARKQIDFAGFLSKQQIKKSKNEGYGLLSEYLFSFSYDRRPGTLFPGKPSNIPQFAYGPMLFAIESKSVTAYGWEAEDQLSSVSSSIFQDTLPRLKTTPGVQDPRWAEFPCLLQAGNKWTFYMVTLSPMHSGRPQTPAPSTNDIAKSHERNRLCTSYTYEGFMVRVADLGAGTDTLAGCFQVFRDLNAIASYLEDSYLPWFNETFDPNRLDSADKSFAADADTVVDTLSSRVSLDEAEKSGPKTTGKVVSGAEAEKETRTPSGERKSPGGLERFLNTMHLRSPRVRNLRNRVINGRR